LGVFPVPDPKKHTNALLKRKNESLKWLDIKLINENGKIFIDHPQFNQFS